MNHQALHAGPPTDRTNSAPPRHNTSTATTTTTATTAAPAAYLNPEWHAAAALMKAPGQPHSQGHFEFPQRNGRPPASSASFNHNQQNHPPSHSNSHSRSPPSSSSRSAEALSAAAPPPPAPAVAPPQPQPQEEESTDITEARGQTELRAIESRRKESHKEVEKRRRENINQGITRLLTLLPPVPFPPPGTSPNHLNPTTSTSSSSNGHPYAASVPPSGTVSSASKQANKAVILESAANYIQHLKDVEQSNIDKWTLEKLLTDQATAELRQQRDHLTDKVERMESLLREHGLRFDGHHHDREAQPPPPPGSLNTFNKRPRVQ